jgi:4-hydroxybenzoate polyprenyltransferase
MLQFAALSSGLTDPFGPEQGSIVLFVATLVGYVALNGFYTTWLKHYVLWDVFIIAAGFVLRALAGAFVAIVAISPWFYLCTLFVSLLLALGKRRAELATVRAEGTRKSLSAYSLELLDHLIAVTVTCALMTYSLYTFQTPTSGHALMLTIPLVIFGVFRYLYLIYIKGEGESPDVLLLRDKQLLLTVVLCVALTAELLYGLPVIRGIISLLPAP